MRAKKRALGGRHYFSHLVGNRPFGTSFGSKRVAAQVRGLSERSTTMAKVVFTPNVQRHVACPEAEAAGRTVREVLENVFAENPQARGYVLDRFYIPDWDPRDDTDGAGRFAGKAHEKWPAVLLFRDAKFNQESDRRLLVTVSPGLGFPVDCHGPQRRGRPLWTSMTAGSMSG